MVYFKASRVVILKTVHGLDLGKHTVCRTALNHVPRVWDFSKLTVRMLLNPRFCQMKTTDMNLEQIIPSIRNIKNINQKQEDC